MDITVIGGRFWIQCDETEYSITQEWLDAGVSKDGIVLAFRLLEKRRLTDFAVV
jgi:XisI protein